MKEDERLQGLCKECTHRNSCPDAKRYLNMTGCSCYKHWKKKRIDKIMNEKEYKLLRFALTLGWVAVEEAHMNFEFCKSKREDYYTMLKKLSEILGVNLEDVAMDY